MVVFGDFNMRAQIDLIQTSTKTGIGRLGAGGIQLGSQALQGLARGAASQ